VKVLPDTHTLLWWAGDDRRLSRRAKALLADPANEVLLSAASAWEIATKYRLHRLPAEVGPLVQDMTGWMTKAGLIELPITLAHARLAGSFPAEHGDPFDRMLAAQSLIEGIPLLGCDEALLAFGIKMIW
jgi:PIN domain nuclease of toxin-antitoxin system